MARRSRGDGSVFYDASRGCWVGSVDIGRDPETGRRRRRKVSAATKTRVPGQGRRAAPRRSARTGTVGRRTSPSRRSCGTCWRTLRADWRSPVTIQVNTGHAGRIIAALGRRSWRR